MLNDRNEGHDQQDDHEESEYHFSDDDISYEVETESPKTVSSGEPSEGFVKRFTRSKRMMISVVVFLFLVFVVFKMVAPSNNGVAEMTPVAAVQPRPMPAAAPMNNAPQAMTQPAAAAPGTMPPTPAVVVSAGPNTQNTPSAAPSAAMGNQQPVAAGAPQAMAAAPMPTSATPSTTMPAAPGGTMPAPLPEQAAASQAVPAGMQAQPGMAPGQPPVANMPAVIPVESTVSAYPGNPGQPPIIPPSAAAGVANLEATNARVITQFQADYTQKLNEYATQNKSMQDQLSTLTARIAVMETQLNQLVHTLTRQQSLGGPEGTVPSSSEAAPAPPASQAMPQAQGYDTKMSAYSVQAIIPGRAWLKSDNGETVTVAEGDAIKDLGRVTKIDPYDGVVEVNTGHKIVSISYGTGG